MGNPFGLGETVTQGIISAKERSLSDNQRDLFQTDAAINPGNSGGPLVNLRGEIIGINVAIFSPDKENPGFQGVGFSIPANDVKDALFQILERGRPIRGFLGVQMRDLDPDGPRGALQYDGEDGAAVLGVSPGSPAQAAGLQPWDVVRSFNGEKIRSATQLFTLVQRTRVGDAVTLGCLAQRPVDRSSKRPSPKAVRRRPSRPTARRSCRPRPHPRSGGNPASARHRSPGSCRCPSGCAAIRGVVVTGVAEDGLAADAGQAGRSDRRREQRAHQRCQRVFPPPRRLRRRAGHQPHFVREGKSSRVTLPAIPRQE